MGKNEERGRGENEEGEGEGSGNNATSSTLLLSSGTITHCHDSWPRCHVVCHAHMTVSLAIGFQPFLRILNH